MPRVRPASPADYGEFVRLFGQLGIDDPVFSAEKFEQELVPTTLFAEVAEVDGEPAPLGYVYFRVLDSITHVVHLVTDAAHRRRGVGAALLRAVAERATAAGCPSWYLNVLPDNEPAKACYRSLGFTESYLSQSLKIAWSAVEAAPVLRASLVARPIDPGEDAAVESALGMVKGQIAHARKMVGRVLVSLHEDGALVGATVFDPSFPGAYPFKVVRAELALPLLRALRPHARPEHDIINLVAENRSDIADVITAAGGVVRVTTLRMNGALPLTH